MSVISVVFLLLYTGFSQYGCHKTITFISSHVSPRTNGNTGPNVLKTALSNEGSLNEARWEDLSVWTDTSLYTFITDVVMRFCHSLMRSDVLYSYARDYLLFWRRKSTNKTHNLENALPLRRPPWNETAFRWEKNGKRPKKKRLLFFF